MEGNQGEGETRRLGLLHMGTSQPPNQQGQEQSISQAALVIFKGDVELLDVCVALTGLGMESPTHWEPLCSVGDGTAQWNKS